MMLIRVTLALSTVMSSNQYQETAQLRSMQTSMLSRLNQSMKLLTPSQI